MEATASSRELSHSGSVRTLPLSHFWHSLSQLLQRGPQGRGGREAEIRKRRRRGGGTGTRKPWSCCRQSGDSLLPRQRCRALHRASGAGPAGWRAASGATLSHPTSEVGQQMTTRLAMGAPPSSACPGELRSVHRRLCDSGHPKGVAKGVERGTGRGGVRKEADMAGAGCAKAGCWRAASTPLRSTHQSAPQRATARHSAPRRVTAHLMPCRVFPSPMSSARMQPAHIRHNRGRTAASRAHGKSPARCCQQHRQHALRGAANSTGSTPCVRCMASRRTGSAGGGCAGATHAQLALAARSCCTCPRGPPAPCLRGQVSASSTAGPRVPRPGLHCPGCAAAKQARQQLLSCCKRGQRAAPPPPRVAPWPWKERRPHTHSNMN